MLQHLEIEIDQHEKNGGIEVKAAAEVVVSQKLSGDVLLEIFIRLPDFRTARRFVTVSRFWHTLICHDPKFVSRFITQHRLHLDRYPPSFPHTIMFRKADEMSTDQPVIRQIFSEEWLNFYGGKSSPDSNYLDFLPNYPIPVVIRASCNDLLLVSSGPNCTTDDLYVCNPYTKQFIKLPTIERLDLPSLRERAVVGYALLCTPAPAIEFEVVEVLPKEVNPPRDLKRMRFTVNVFCSESRDWERSTYRYNYSRVPALGLLPLDVVVHNEGFYWMENGCSSSKFFYFYLSEGWRSGRISLPPHNSDYHRHRVGVVHVLGGLGEPELRLIRVAIMRGQRRVHLKIWRFHLKIWRLPGESKWDLVHETRFKRSEGVSEGDKLLVPFVHPTNGHLVYIVWGRNLVKASYRLIDELPETVEDLISVPMFLPYVRSNLQGNAQL